MTAPAGPGGPGPSRRAGGAGPAGAGGPGPSGGAGTAGGRGLAPQEAVERALALSRADSAVVIAEAVTDANLRWAANTLTTNGVSRGGMVTVISIIGGATGVVSRQGVSADSLEDLVRAAEATARESAPADDAAPLVGPVEHGRWEDPPADSSISVFERFAPDLGAAFERAEGSDQLLFGFAAHQMRTTYVGSTAGLRARHQQPTGHVEINAKSPDYARSAWAGVPTADFSDVDVAALSEDLSTRLGWAARTVDLPAGRYETILPPSAVADLMIYLYWSAGARDAFDGRTVFSRPGGGTRVGERLTDTPLTLRSDPGAASVPCPPFVIAHESSAANSVFDNGLPLEPTDWIAEGVLTSLVQTRRTAALTGLPVTPYIDNLVLTAPVGGAGGVGAAGDLAAGGAGGLSGGAGAAGGLSELIQRTGRGLLLTCLWYIREVDPQTLLLTGLTRDGVYLVEGGEVVGSVNNFRFNESPVDLLDRVRETGAAVRTLPREWCDYFTRTVMPPLRVADFNMSSVSRAS